MRADGLGGAISGKKTVMARKVSFPLAYSKNAG
jgi:hypothetical protein